MSEVTKKILVEDFYKTTLVDWIADSWDIDFEVVQAPENTMWFIVINPESSLKRERMFYHNVVWNRIYVRSINRYWPKEHLAWDIIQINDTSLVFNYLSENVSTTFYVEKLWALQVNIWWWPILLWETQTLVNDKTINLSNNNTNYIYYRESDNTIQTSTSLATIDSEKWIITVVIICASWVISSINYKKYSILKWIKWEDWIDWLSAYEVAVEEWFVWTKEQWLDSLKWETWEDWKSAYEIAVDEWFIWTEEEWLESLKWEKWDTWDIWEPTPTGQFIEDVIIVDTSLYTVTTNNSTFVKITENATWDYVWYNLNWRVWADSDNNVSNYELVSWTWWTIWLLEWITYTDWLSIDTDWTIRYTGQPAYRDKINNFTETNTFNWYTIFKWNVSFPFSDMDLSWTTITFDWSKWTKQKVVLNSDWAYTINFTNLSQSANYVFAIISEATVSLTIWTASWVDLDWNPQAFDKFSIWWQTYPITWMTTWWPYIFVCETFTSWIHISYTWKSTPIT